MTEELKKRSALTQRIGNHLVDQIHGSHVIVHLAYDATFHVFNTFIVSGSRIFQEEVLGPIAPEKTGIDR